MTTRAALSMVPALVTVCFSTVTPAADISVDPADTQIALNTLLSAANERIPPNSSCHGNYSQPGPARVKDLVGMQLAYLYRGENVIKGRCTGQNDRQCMLSITHAFGEDVSSAEISFRTKAGKIRLETLACVMTP